MYRYIGLLALGSVLTLASFGSRLVAAEPQRPSQVSPAAAGFHEGDAVVATRHADLMVGYHTVGHVTPGQKLSVLKVRDGWIGTSVEANGKKTYGWLWGAFASEEAAANVAGQPRAYRSYSYEPSESASSSALASPRAVYPRTQRAFRGGGYRISSRGSGKPLYLLPKGDPRKSGGR